MRMTKRILATILTLAMALTVLPATALAEEATDSGKNNYYETDAVTDPAVAEVQALIDALPNAEDITADNAGEVTAQLDAIDEAKAALADEQMEQLDFARYAAAAEALSALAGQPGANEPNLLMDADMSGNCGATGNEDKVTWALAENGTDSEGNKTYTLTISGSGAMADYPSWAPAGETDPRPWANYLASITAIVVEDGITRIGNRAFHFINQIGSDNRPNPLNVTITFPESLKEIGEEACVRANISTIDIPEAVKSLGISAFYQCKNLATITGLEGVQAVGNYAFYGCASVTSDLTLTSAETIGANAFSGCEKLAGVSIPSATEIGASAFNGCSALTSIDVSNVETIGQSAFQNCTGLQSISFPKVTSIPWGVVKGCTNLKSITLNKNVTAIANETFKDCTALESIDFCGAEVELINYMFNNYTNLVTVQGLGNATVGEYAFNGCSSLKKITFGPNATVAGTALNGCIGLEEIDFGGAAVTVVSSMFETTFDDSGNCTKGYPNLKCVLGLGNARTADNSAWNRAFINCKNLEKIDFGGAEIALGSYIFTNCEKLTTLTGLENVTALSGEGTIRALSSLTSFTIPAAITTINTTYLFSGCPQLKVIDFTEVTNLGGVTFTSSSESNVFAKTCEGAAIYVKSQSDADAISTYSTYYPLLNTDGGIIDVDTAFDSSTGLLTPTKDGFVFSGWYSGTGEGTKLEGTPSANTTYTAKWTASSYKVEDKVEFSPLTYGDTPTSQEITVTTDPAVEGASVTGVTSSASFGASFNGMTVTITPIANLPVGTYKETIIVTTGDGATHNVAVSLTVTKAGSTVTPDKSEITDTYGNTIELTANVTKTAAQAAVMLADMDSVAQDKVAFYCGDTLLGTADVSYTDEAHTTGSATLRYDTSKGGIPVGSAQTITARYGGSVTLNGNSANSISVTLTPAPLTVTGLTATDRVYDGSTSVDLTGGALSGTIGNDEVSMTATGAMDDAGAGNGKSVNVSVTLNGDDASKYTVIAPTDVTVTITPATLTAAYQSEEIYVGGTPKLEVAVTGFVNGETAATADGYTAPTVTNSNTAAGSYTLTPSGGSATNYVFSYTPGTLTIRSTGIFVPSVPTTPTTPSKPTEPDEPDTPVIPGALPFVDVGTGDWYYEDVAYVYAQGIMTGSTASTFAPNNAMTRAMVWTVLGRMSGENVEGGTPWYALAQAWAVSDGVSDGTGPNDSITREQLVTMLYRQAGSPEVGVSELALLGRFTDGEAVSAWAEEAMAWAVAQGVLTGDGDLLKPQAAATRAQVAAILARYCENIEK